MKKTRRAKITIEKERLLVIRNQQLFEKWCQFCKTEVKMVDLSQAASIAAASQRQIFRRVENGLLHFVEMANGNLLICLNSLRQNFFRCE